MNCTDDVCRRFVYCQNKQATGICPCSECITNPTCTHRCSDYFNYCMNGDFLVNKDEYGKMVFTEYERDGKKFYANIIKKEKR